MPVGVLKFEEFELDRGRYELRRGDSVLKLEKIPMELLVLLAEGQGQLVTRDQIVERIWGKDVSSIPNTVSIRPFEKSSKPWGTIRRTPASFRP